MKLVLWEMSKARGRGGGMGAMEKWQGPRWGWRLDSGERVEKHAGPQTSAPAIVACQGILHCSPAPEIKE